MPRSPEEIALTERFDRQYERGQHETMRAIERSVCGCDFGGTSWTTRSEADRVGALLKLRPGTALLDIGAGSGWPALYMAEISGCDFTLVDLPLAGLQIAVRRAAADALKGSCRVAVADACALPLENGLFDAISHSDVLCCLQEKSAVLRECRRVVKATGAMVFTVISIAPGLPSNLAEIAVTLGPPYIAADCDYSEMLEKSGWRVNQCMDLSAEYAASTQSFVDQWRKNEDQVRLLVGVEEYDDFVDRKGRSIEYIRNGTIRRQLYATVPV